MLDLLIIGAGLAGLSAALTAAEAGLRVRVIAKGLGVTHWHAGTIDLLGYLPGQNAPVSDPFAAFDALPAQHPYRKLSIMAVEAALRHFQQVTNELSLSYGPTQHATRNTLLPSPVGAPRPVYLAPAAQLAGDLGRREPMVIVGLRGWRDFYPALIAANLTKLGHTARADFLPVAVMTQRRDFNTVHLAEALDRPDTVERVVMALRPLIQPGERVGLPAILGLQRHTAIWTRLQEQLGAPVFEIPTLPPSVPGLRLFHTLRDHLSKLGVRVEIGMEAIGFAAEGRQIRSVATGTSARPLQHHARHFLLATGGVLGGGFNSDHTGRCWETIFNLPLTVPQDRRQWFRHQFLHPAGQPIFTGGVAVNDQFQPVDRMGAVVYDNLWAAGGVLAYADPIRERSLEGLAITTGVAAVQPIINQQSAI